MRWNAILVAAFLGLGCAAPPPPEPGSVVRLVCGHQLRFGPQPHLFAFTFNGEFVGNLALGSLPVPEITCREISIPPMPPLPPLSREGLANGPGILVEQAP